MHKIVHILDIRGLIINSWNSRKDPDAATGEDGRPLLTVEHGLDALHEKFLHDIFHTYDAAPRDIVVVWDGGNKYRTSLYPGYKGNRVRTAKKEISERRVRKDELLVRVKRLLGSIGVTQVTLADEEADDVAGYLAWKISHQCPVIIHTIDHDLVACRSWGAKHPIMVAVNGDIERQFTNKGGSGDAVPPHLITLYKSLVGDKTDEYLGIAGFGPKAWDEFMAEFGADGMVQLDGVIRTLNPRILDLATQSSPNKWLSHLRGHMDEWALQYRLAGIHPWLCEGVRENKPIHLKWHKEVPSYTALAEATKGLPEPARKALRARYEKWLPVPFVMDSTNAVAVWEHMKDEITGLPFFPFDYETYDVLQHEPFKEAAGGRGEYVDVISSRPTGMSFCYGNNWQYAPYMTVEHKDSHNLPQSWIPGILNAVIEAGVPTLAHNQQFEYSVTWNNFGIRLPQPWDSRLMSHAIDENNSNGLKDVSSRFLGFYQMGYKETLEAAGANNMAECTSQDVLSYGVDDSLATAHFADLAWFIQVCEGTWEFTRDEDFNFVHEQSRAFLTGINFDQDRMAALETRDLASEVESEKNLRQLLADNPNIEPREAILRLFNDLWEYEQAKLSDSDPNMDPQDLQQRRLNLWDKLVGLSTYAPLTRTVETKEFVPSKVQLSKISERLGFEPFEKDSKKYISEWLLLQDERLAQADQAEAPEYEDMNTFHRRLAAALKDIKKREGAEYEEFATWCKTFLGIEDKVTTEGTELNVGSPQQMQGLL